MVVFFERSTNNNRDMVVMGRLLSRFESGWKGEREALEAGWFGYRQIEIVVSVVCRSIGLFSKWFRWLMVTLLTEFVVSRGRRAREVRLPTMSTWYEVPEVFYAELALRSVLSCCYPILDWAATLCRTGVYRKADGSSQGSRQHFASSKTTIAIIYSAAAQSYWQDYK